MIWVADLENKDDLTVEYFSRRKKLAVKVTLASGEKNEKRKKKKKKELLFD